MKLFWIHNLFENTLNLQMVSFKSQFKIQERHKSVLNMGAFLPIDHGCHSHPPADFTAEYQELAFHSPPAGLLPIQPLV